ncbi:hypothetical protein EDB89DRAFT_2071701 [Lactarius sanguifluus]|nr:hypothetical protein EDB89DRAFT_2071701 [Lactarius sanguifluus]
MSPTMTDASCPRQYPILMLISQQEGDDISNLEIPKDEPTGQEQASLAPSSPAPPSHIAFASPFPTPEKIKGTGVRGMLTKGDVLTFLGKAVQPNKPTLLGPGAEAPKKAEAKVEKDYWTGSQFASSSKYLKARAGTVPLMLASFDTVIADYLPPPTTRAASTLPPVLPPKPKSGDFLDGLVNPV